ncbi:hypothetical protein BC835DRAFT_872512 [Cytidiella melzeri]|nr:hypothetical protein BC835DRAFT_872512 [Cytidiella melzeri]
MRCLRWFSNPQSFSTLERAISDQSDILGAGCLKEVTRCHRYREEDLNPPDIGPNDYFQRYSVDFENGDISPEPGAFTCLPQCSRPYNPFPGAKKGRLRKVKVDEFNPIWDVMHFCPRPQCNGRWYHRSCLAQAGYRDNESSVYVGDRRVRLLAADPDSEDLHPTFVDFATLRSDLEDSHDVDQVQGPSKPLPSALDFLPTSISRRLCHLPAELVTIAAQPIVRRALAPHSYSDCRSGVFSTVGTMKEVVLARRLVYQALEGEHERLEQLCSRLLQSSADAPYWADSDLRDDVRDTIRVFASPRKKYWQDRASLSEPDFLRDVGQCPSTVCPQCGSAI